MARSYSFGMFSKLGVAGALVGAGLMSVIGTTAVNAQAFSVVDQRDKSIEFSAPAKRLVIIPIPMSSVVIALDGSTKRIAAMHPVAVKSVRGGFLGKIFPEAANIPSDIVAGGRFNPNLESVLALRPDAVIQWKSPDKIIAPLENAGLKVVGLQNNPKSQALNERNLTILASVIGQTDRLKQILSRHHARLDEIAAQSKKLSQADRPRALYLRIQGGTLRAAGTGIYQNFWLNLGGGINPAAEAGLKGLAPVTDEQIIEWNPDIIILSAFDKMKPAEIYAKPVFAGLKAVQNRRVYKIPHGGYRWDPASHESHLAWTWAAMVLNPDVFKFSLREDMRSAYKLFYRHDLTNAEIDAILQMPLNRESAGYAAFAPR